MNRIFVIFHTGEGVTIPANTNIKILSRNPKNKNYFYNYSVNLVFPTVDLQTIISNRVSQVMSDFDGNVLIKTHTSVISGSESSRSDVLVMLEGNFNFDGLYIDTELQTRVEIRNEYGVLIVDNGLPWGDGTYPPDAKNRAGLTGLHAAPAVINPELETALMGDETNKEVELTGSERGAGVQYALEKDEDNGL